MRIIISIDVFILGSEIRSERPLAALRPADGVGRLVSAHAPFDTSSRDVHDHFYLKALFAN